ncbi:hypothetical protein MKK84_24490 [Methylobacterium sp. E-065]|uniref:hypothetical protein n=1 Tax=Methylobacterium sp. E-065 TaxID=2836583 RepID=UPI001FB9E4CE|nr:hypothetical protein [Methylobacterium sp. E-065]MCJ2020547.1 hypothetical protein [Methylobacterium sp. E-065]
MTALPCPRCAGTDWDGHDDRHTETNMDRCRDCGGTGQIPAATGERRETSCDPATGRAFVEWVSAGEGV